MDISQLEQLLSEVAASDYANKPQLIRGLQNRIAEAHLAAFVPNHSAASSPAASSASSPHAEELDSRLASLSEEQLRRLLNALSGEGCLIPESLLSALRTAQEKNARALLLKLLQELPIV